MDGGIWHCVWSADSYLTGNADLDRQGFSVAADETVGKGMRYHKKNSFRNIYTKKTVADGSTVFPFTYKLITKIFRGLLRNAVDSFGKTGNFSGAVIFVVNALGCSFADCGDCVLKSNLCSCLILILNCCLNFLDGSLNCRTDCFVSCSLSAVN